MQAGCLLADEINKPCVVIIKHANPCGVSKSNNLLGAYKSAFNCDPISAFGGIIIINGRVDEKLAKEISKTFYALNDFVIDRGKSQRILKMNLFSNGQFVSEYKADGLVFATPTGSTAYSLSAGGPIVMPKLRAIVVSPLSPHTLTLRPIVVSDDQLLEIKFPDHEKVAFAVDGQVNEYLDPDTKIIIQKSPYDIRMISFKDSNYFQTLMLKMGWGKRGKN